MCRVPSSHRRCCDCTASSATTKNSMLTEEVLFELIKSKCLPILLYGRVHWYIGTEGRTKDLYSEMWVHFGTDCVENVVANRKIALLTDMVKQAILLSVSNVVPVHFTP